PAVVSDISAAITEAVRPPRRRGGGARRLGFIAGPRQTTTGRERLAEFTAAAEGPGVEVITQPGDFQEESGRQGMCALLAAEADAVLTADSRMTLGAVRACLDAGITPVRDLPFIGFDEISPFALLQPRLPLICQDLEGMATRSVQLLTAQLAGESAATEHRFPAQLCLPTDPTRSEAGVPAHA